MPIDQEAELDLGPVKNVLVQPVLMKTETKDFTFDKHGDIAIWKKVHWKPPTSITR